MIFNFRICWRTMTQNLKNTIPDNELEGRVYILLQIFALCLVYSKHPINVCWGTSLMVQWLRLWTSTAGGTGSIPGRGIKILYAVQRSQNTLKKKKLLNEWKLFLFSNKFSLNKNHKSIEAKQTYKIPWYPNSYRKSCSSHQRLSQCFSVCLVHILLDLFLLK